MKCVCTEKIYYERERFLYNHPCPFYDRISREWYFDRVAQAVAISYLQWQVPETSTLPLMNKASAWTCKPLQFIEDKTQTRTSASPCMYVYIYVCSYVRDFSKEKELVLKPGLHCSNLETSYINHL